MPETFAIEPKGGPHSGKGRSFSVYALNYALANRAWLPLSRSPENRHRPAYIAYAATEQESRAFTANLRKGRPFVAKSIYGGRDAELDMPRSAGYRWLHQRVEGGVIITTALLPDLFLLDAGMLDERIRFIFAPPRWWVSKMAAARPEGPSLGRETVIATYFAAMLDRRTPQPIINDSAFHILLLRAARACPWFQPASGSRTSPGNVFVWPEGGSMPGFDELALVDVSHADFEAFLAEQTGIYAQQAPAWLLEEPEPEPDPITPLAAAVPEEAALGTLGGAGRSWVLSDPHTAPQQLKLPGFL
jgi:hypothetical protein